jgi:eukaryotic-like serine/threonine-protein kinase
VELEPHALLAGRYRIIDVLAKGGQGVVYRALDERLDRRVAVKTVRFADPHLVVRLRREAQLLARLTHPNVVSLYDVGEHEGRPYLVTQFVDGVPLRRLLGRMTARRIAWVAEQIAYGLAAAHSLGIVHRDLKPSNVLVGDDTVRLLDFGIAHHIDDTTAPGPDAILGTAAYISPEQLRGEPPGPGADIYALGLVLLECFSGRAAFEGTFAETVEARMVAAPDLPATVPEAWHELIERMTDADPARRPTAAVVAAAARTLGRARPGETVAPLPVEADGTPEHRVPVAPSTVEAPPEPPVPAVDWVAEPAAAGAFDSEPPARRRALTRSAVVVPAAAAVGFAVVLIVGSMVTSSDPEPAARGLVADQTEDTEPPPATLPLTQAVPTTEVTTTTVATTLPPITRAVVPPPPPPTTTAPTPPPPPPPPPTTAAPRTSTTRPRTATTESDAARRWREMWEEWLRRRGDR